MSDHAGGFTRSAVVLARLLGCDRTTVFRWRELGMPWREPTGFPIEECAAWARARREAQEARRAGGDAAALAELRRHRARLGWHRVDRARAKVVPATWATEQHANRTEHLRRTFEVLAADLVPGLVGAHPRAVRTALEAGFRRVCEQAATASPEVPVPQPEPVGPTLESEPAVRPGETATAAAKRWLIEVHRAESARVELALAVERGEVVPLAHVDDALAERAQALRRALQAAARALATELGRLPEPKTFDRLHEELREVLASYSRPLPRPPEPTDAETRAEDLGDDLRELEHDDVRDSEDNPNTETDR